MSIIRSLTDRFRRSAPHRPPGRVSDNPQWHDLPADAVSRIAGRLQRLHEAFSSRYRLDGNLNIPYFHRVRDGKIYTSLPKPYRPVISAQQAHATLSDAQMDTLLRSILAQLEQLEHIGFVHGALSAEQLVIYRSGKHFIGSIDAPEHGRFADEPMNAENEYSSGTMSPEMYRKITYPAWSALPNDDIFSAGCLFHLLLTGDLPAAFGLPAAQALACAIPPVPALKNHFYAFLIRRMLAPDPAQRPSASQLLEAMCAAPALPPTGDERRFCQDAAGQWQLIHMLPWLWDPGGAPTGALLTEQQQFRQREADRIADICIRSHQWHAACGTVAPSQLILHSDVPYTCAPMPACALTLGRLHLAEDSIFVLDARFTDILYAVQALHDDGCILGAVSPDLFCAGIGDPFSRIHLLELHGALPLDRLPQPQDIRPDKSAALLLSPEMAQYICSPNAGAAADARMWIGPASDIFSLGLIYHLLLTGEYPRLTDPERPTYACAAAYDNGNAICLNERLDAPHRQLIRRMLSMDPSARPARCDGIALEIMDLYTD